jgi:hypothetical protein
MEVEMKPLVNPVPVLRIRIPPCPEFEDEEEYDRFSDNESDGTVDIVDWLDEVDPEWESKVDVVTVFWSWTVTVRLSENLYNAVHGNTEILDAIRRRIFNRFIWKNEVKFEVW